MPAKNSIRNFEENGIYHIYNRGLNKTEVFKNSDDFETFLYYLSVYLLPTNRVLLKYPDLPLRLQTKNLSQEVDCLSFCLMPNHFHLLLKAKTKTGISKLIKQLTNAYTFYFNNKYGRVGPLYQGVYKSLRIRGQKELVHTCRFLDLNPVTAFLVENPKDYKWSSYSEYLNGQGDICNLSPVLEYFPSTSDWKKFVLDQKDYSRSLSLIKHLTLEN